MSKKVTALIAGLVASLAFVFILTGTMQGCGSSSSSNDFKSVCNQGCDKFAGCAGDADAMTVAMSKTQCQMACNSQPTCSNDAARISAAKACLAMTDCTTAGECALGIPACQTATGTGGSGGSGTGGSGTGGSGTGGTSGGSWTCMDQPASGGNPAICVCLQMTGGDLTSCPTSETCCFTFDSGGTTACSCTTPPAGATCAQLVAALSGTQKSSCP